METIKSTTVAGLNKKADFGQLESIKDQIVKKVDAEYF